MNTLMYMLAQATDATGGGNGGQQAPQAQPDILRMMLPMLIFFVLFMWLMGRSQKKREKQQREQLYANLNKSVRVVTIGGIVGTIASVKDNEVVLKTDESTNTKMTFLKSAIQRVISEEGDETR